MSNTTILNDLDQYQMEAVKQTDGPVLILAGAGSGKTRVLTYKVAYLISKGVKASQIVAVTFTNKAANEMKERVIRLLGHLETQSPTYPTSVLSMHSAPKFWELTESILAYLPDIWFMTATIHFP